MKKLMLKANWLIKIIEKARKELAEPKAESVSVKMARIIVKGRHT